MQQLAFYLHLVGILFPWKIHKFINGRIFGKKLLNIKYVIIDTIIDKIPKHALFIQHYISLAC